MQIYTQCYYCYSNLHRRKNMNMIFNVWGEIDMFENLLY
jgi:hypothetical protein